MITVTSMCIKCHSGISDEVVVQQLSDQLKNPNYGVWNETSIGHLTIALMGANGEEASKCAETLLEGYIGWRENNILSVMMKSFGLTSSSPSKEYVEKALNDAKEQRDEFRQKGYTADDIKHHFFYEETAE